MTSSPISTPAVATALRGQRRDRGLLASYLHELAAVDRRDGRRAAPAQAPLSGAPAAAGAAVVGGSPGRAAR